MIKNKEEIIAILSKTLSEDLIESFFDSWKKFGQLNAVYISWKYKLNNNISNYVAEVFKKAVI